MRRLAISVLTPLVASCNSASPVLNPPVVAGNHDLPVLTAGNALPGGGAVLHDSVPGPPVAQVRPVTDTYFGTEVVDPYRYLENLADPQVQAWMKGQADFTRATLDALSGRTALLARVHALNNADLTRDGLVRRGERYFYQVTEPGAPVPKLYYRDGLTGAEHLLVDPGALGQGTTTHFALDYYQPSWDGRWLAYGLSAGGSEQSVLHVMDVGSGHVLGEAIDRTANDVVSWRPDNRSFFYYRYNKPGPTTPASETAFNARTYLHTVGARVNGEEDPVVFGRGVASGLDVPEGQATYLVAAPDSPWAIAVADHNMDGNATTLYVAPLEKVVGAATPWRRIATVDDGVTQFALHTGRMVFVSHKGALRGRLLAMSLAHPEGPSSVVLAEGKAVLTDFALAKEGIYARLRDGAVSKLVLLSLESRSAHPVPLPFEGNVSAPRTDPRQAGALFSVQGWIQGPRIIAYNPTTDACSDSKLAAPSKIDTSQLETREVFAPSYDGTMIPLSIISKKGLELDGRHPTLLTGYGSYGYSFEPAYWPIALAWIEHNGIVAIAHVRGGGEYGEAWHLGGQKLSKPNTILDFIACGQYLVDRHYTAPKLLAASGASAGGVTVGGALTWRPDLFGVILDDVGMSDTLRSETEPNGPPNVSEFGSVRDEIGFHGLYAMSAYEHVRGGTPYPAVMFNTGANDPRVAPWHMLKMAARVQAATSSHAPVLLRIDYDAGHGIGSSSAQIEAHLADEWSFAFSQMGEPGFVPASHATQRE